MVGDEGSDLSPARQPRFVLSDRIDPAEFASARGLRSAYRAALADAVAAAGRDRAVRAGVASETLTALESAEAAGPTLTEAAVLLSLTDGWPDRETVERELRDDLLVGMSDAVLDAAAAARLAGPRLDAGAVRAAVDGDRDLTLAEYAQLRFAVASEVPD